MLNKNKNPMVPQVCSEFKVRSTLEKAVDNMVILESFGEIVFEGKSNEYREYSLISKCTKQGIDYGNIDDMLTVYHAWKHDETDNTMRIFLEYEKFDYNDGKLTPSRITKEVGLLLKISK